MLGWANKTQFLNSSYLRRPPEISSRESGKRCSFLVEIEGRFSRNCFQEKVEFFFCGCQKVLLPEIPSRKRLLKIISPVKIKISDNFARPSDLLRRGGSPKIDISRSAGDTSNVQRFRLWSCWLPRDELSALLSHCRKILIKTNNQDQRLKQGVATIQNSFFFFCFCFMRKIFQPIRLKVTKLI